MQMHQSSNFATYCDEIGKPIFDIFFALFDIGDGLQLYGFEDWQQRESALADGERRRMNCRAVKHVEAFQMACQGVSLWLFDGVASYRPLYLNRRQGVGWKPVLAVANQ